MKNKLLIFLCILASCITCYNREPESTECGIICAFTDSPFGNLMGLIWLSGGIIVPRSPPTCYPETERKMFAINEKIAIRGNGGTVDEQIYGINNLLPNDKLFFEDGSKLLPALRFLSVSLMSCSKSGDFRIPMNCSATEAIGNTRANLTCFAPTVIESLQIILYKAPDGTLEVQR